jgi:hypothetical protein
MATKKTTKKPVTKAAVAKPAPKQVLFTLSDEHKQAIQGCLEKGTLTASLKNVSTLARPGKARLGAGSYLWD